MRQIRLFTDTSLEVGITTELEDNLKYHLDKVLRFKKGMPLTLFNGDGYDYHSELTHLDRQQALVTVNSKVVVNNECDIDITLYCALLKSDSLDRVVQKSVELGVKKLVLMQTKHTEVTFKPSRLSSKMTHWQGVIIASTQQCGRAKIMQIEQPIKFDEAIVRDHGAKWIFSPHHKMIGESSLNMIDKVGDIGLMIGPEGGFHQEEVRNALTNHWQTKSLGARILRADTAAISSVIFAQCQYSQEFEYG